MKNFLLIVSSIIIITFAFTNTSCIKNTDSKATISVVDSSGIFVGNATVKLFANVKTATNGTVVADVKANGTTDDGGSVKFTFKLPAIMDITASKVVKTKSGATLTLTGTGIIKLEEGKGTEKTVTIR